MTEIAIIKVLLAASSVTALVSTRITSEIRPQKATFPAITVNLNNTDYSDTKSGVSTVDESFIDVSIYARNYKDLYNVSDVVNVALDRYSGTIDIFDIQSIRKIDESVYTDQIADSLVYVKDFEFKVRIKR